MEIDSSGRMWIIDTGNTPQVADVPSGMLRICPPRIVIMDIASTQVIRSHTFDPAVANRSTTFLNDIVLDQTRGLAYISITSGDGGLIVYSFATNSGRFYSGASTKAQPFATTIVINGLSYNFTAPADTLALSPDTETLYYGALAGFTMFSLPTSVLSNFSASTATIDAAVQAVFNRTSDNGALTQCDGMTTSAQGSFFYGSFGNPFENSIVQRLPNGTVVQLYDNTVTMQWVDTLGWAGPGTLIFSTNRLQKYFAEPMQLNFSETNFHLISVAVPGQTSYLEAQNVPETSQSPFITSTSSSATTVPGTTPASTPTPTPPPAPTKPAAAILWSAA
jgi:sugar lactone lactonase YvrE